MNDVKDNLPTENSVAVLRAECAGLRQQVWTLLVLSVVVSGTLATYLYRQDRIARRDIENAKPQVNQILQVFNQNRPAIENCIKQLVTYGSTHPDFQPVLQKYGLPISLPTAAAPAKK